MSNSRPVDGMDPVDDMDPVVHYTSGGKSYAMTGKIMLSAIVILFFVVALMVFLHLYARWYLLRARRRQLSLRARTRSARTHIVFHFENAGANHHHPAGSQTPQLGLDPAVIKSLPVFVHSPETDSDAVDCAVCLSEFEEGETGRILPKCNHCFHIECIDMWFHSHSTCPLCRAPVELPVNPNPVGPGSSCEGPSSGPRKPMGGLAGITLEVPSRRFNSGLDDDSVASTPTQFRSPVGRILSFTRILSRERRPPSPSPSSSVVAGGGSLPEVDLERGKEEAGQESIRV